MKKVAFIFFTILMLSLMTSMALAKTTRVAVIDTGFDYKSTWPNISKQKNDEGMPMYIPKLCADGHIDFTQTGLQDTHGHGTHVAGIIATYADTSDYCLIVIKNFDANSKTNNVDATVLSFNHAIKAKADVINYSGGGEEFSLEEYEVIQKALNKGIIVVTAAGNYGKDDKSPSKGPQRIDALIDFVEQKSVVKDGKMLNEIRVRYINNITLETSVGLRLGYYPANYDKRIIAVQNLDRTGRLAKSSRFGAAYIYKEIGVDVLSLGLNNTYKYMTGTSKAAPKITAKIIKGFEKK